MALYRHVPLPEDQGLVATLSRCEQQALAKRPVELVYISQWVGGGRQLTDQSARLVDDCMSAAKVYGNRIYALNINVLS